MRNVVLALIGGVLGLQSLVFAAGSSGGDVTNPSDPDSSDVAFPFPAFVNFHRYNKTTALGSALMVGNQSDPATWKAVTTYTCWADGAIAIPESTMVLHQKLSLDHEPCLWGDVLMTTKNQMYECPDGQAFIQRSGDGVAVSSVTEGLFFGWTEAYLCDGAIPARMDATRLSEAAQSQLNIRDLIVHRQ